MILYDNKNIFIIPMIEGMSLLSYLKNNTNPKFDTVLIYDMIGFNLFTGKSVKQSHIYDIISKLIKCIFVHQIHFSLYDYVTIIYEKNYRELLCVLMDFIMKKYNDVIDRKVLVFIEFYLKFIKMSEQQIDNFYSLIDKYNTIDFNKDTCMNINSKFILSNNTIDTNHVLFGEMLNIFTNNIVCYKIGHSEYSLSGGNHTSIYYKKYMKYKIKYLSLKNKI
jgi:hypothetical protein